ncbi:MAG TPA: hypothetical protein VLU25_19555 [Acidobacteriota bacterium]|nr:hypothetical protein [Acidobacteriota bacterium]
MDNYFNYFTEIEEYFVRKRGKNLLVSPLDWCLIELWRDSGIPLNIALRGIDRSFEAAEKRGRPAPRSLYYCHPAILEAHQEHQQAMLGKDEEEDREGMERRRQEDGLELSRPKITADIGRILALLEARSAEPYGRACRRLEALKQEVEGASFVSFEEVDRELSEIGASLADELLEELPGESVGELKKEIRRETRVYKKKLEKESFERLQRSYLQRRLLEEQGLPPFSLLV